MLLLIGFSIFLFFGLGLEAGLTTKFGMNPGLGSQAIKIPDLKLPTTASIYLLSAVAIFLGAVQIARGFACGPGDRGGGSLLRDCFPDLGSAREVLQPGRHVEQLPGSRHTHRTGCPVRCDQRALGRDQHRHRRHDAHGRTDAVVVGQR